MIDTSDSTRRFSARVADYVRARPGYPAALVDALAQTCGLGPGVVVADVGSGTGISSRLFIDRGCTVFGVEPNSEMRLAAEAALAGRASFTSVAGRAESTTLADASVDLVTAGQAFHWFDREAARREWRRVLRPAGHAALFWNTRLTDTSPFLAAYEALIRRYATDYEAVEHRRMTPAIIGAFFAVRPRTFAFPNRQTFDYQGLERRLLSSSYVPLDGQTGHREMLAALGRLFEAHHHDGVVDIDYRTELHVGRLKRR